MSIVSVQEILNYINRKEFEPLLKVDQLNLEREKNKVFLRFGEYACVSTRQSFYMSSSAVYPLSLCIMELISQVSQRLNICQFFVRNK